jgi:hypothetical protein
MFALRCPGGTIDIQLHNDAYKDGHSSAKALLGLTTNLFCSDSLERLLDNLFAKGKSDPAVTPYRHWY